MLFGIISYDMFISFYHFLMQSKMLMLIMMHSYNLLLFKI